MYGDKLKLLKQNQNTIIQYYQSGQTIKSLGKDFEVSEMTMRKFLISNDIKTRSNPFERKFDEQFFHKQSNELAYFMGFCFADGSITAQDDHRSTLEISVHTKDKCVLQKFCQWTNYNEDYITKRSGKEMLRLCYNSKLFKQDFSSWGLVNNKTYEPCIPSILPEYIKPFLIGYIDGDGSIKFSKEQNQFNIVGNRILIDWFCDTIKNLGFDQQFKFEDIEGKVWKRARIYTKEDILSMIKCLEPQQYQKLFLPRKWDTAITLLSKN